MKISTARFLTAVLVLTFLGTTAFSQVAYFPKRSLDTSPNLDKLLIDSYSAQLKAFKEPSLFELSKSPTAQSYRFLWLRTFHHPIAVRLDIKADGAGILTTKVTSGAGGYEPGTLIENSKKPLTSQQTHAFLAKIQQTNFWLLPTATNDQRGNDGSQWMIEGVNAGRYHVVTRWSPKTGPIRDLGITLAIDLAGLNIPKDEFY